MGEHKKKMAEGNEEMRALFKLLNNNRIDIKQINQLSKQLTDLVPKEKLEQASFQEKSIKKQDSDDITEIKFFPNKKTQLNYEEFCQIFEESAQATLDNDDMLFKCFKIFDVTKSN